MSDTLRRTHARIANTLGELAPMFHKGCKLTFVMRDPRDDEAYVVVGDDTNDAVIEVLKRAKSKEKSVLTPGDVVADFLGLEA